VRLEDETVWLTHQQMGQLFGRERSVVSKHVRSVFREGELEEKSNVHFLHIAGSDKPVGFYNLDVIIAVGYRVNSKRGTQFRIWATQTLREHLVRGFTLHERRLRERGLTEVEQAVSLLARTLTSNAMVTEEGRAVLDVVKHYGRAWRWLLEYDEGRLAEAPPRPQTPRTRLTLTEARVAVSRLREELTARGEAGSLFGQERGSALAAALGAIEQTFDGRALYPSAQARAANLLYFVIKDHPYGDGNKRIGALLFLEYLRRNELLTRSDGHPRLDDTAVVALALLIAESAPTQKEIMTRLVMTLLETER
jgi:prophage maintenance system killer protein